MTTTPIPDQVLLMDLHPTRFLRVEDFTERWQIKEIHVTITRLTSEETIPQAKDIDPATHKPRIIMQPVLYFQNKDGAEYPRGMLLGAGENVKALRSATGARTVGELKGKRITIAVSEFKSKPVLRINPKPAKE